MTGSNMPAHFIAHAGSPPAKTAARSPGERAFRGKPTTRTRILDVARRLFGQQGFTATTVRDIARHCGITDGALYYYFRSKREILDALWGSPWTRDLPVPASRTTVVSETLDNLVDELLDGVTAQEALLRVMLRQALSGDPTALALRNQTTAEFEDYVFRRFHSFCDEDRARELADSFALLFLGIFHNHQIELGERFGETLRTPDFHRHVKTLVRLVIPATELETADPAAPCAP